MAFRLPHVQLLGINHCSDSFQNEFKCQKSYQDVLCHCDYAGRVFAIFPHQIQSEYYGGNRSVYIEGIVLEHSSALPDTGINASTKWCPLHAVFHSFLSNDSKQDTVTTNVHRKNIIEFLKEEKYWRCIQVEYGKILMVVRSNIDVPRHYTVCQLCPNVTQL